MKRKVRSGFILILPFLVIVLAAFIVSQNFYQCALIQGKSMEPNYHSMELVLLNKYDAHYDYNDTIAFRSEGTNSILFKRIVALPGDTVEIQNHTLYVNDAPYTSELCDYSSIAYAGIAQTKITLEADTYFVLGDNLSESKDSRYQSIGCIYAHDIIGKVSAILPPH